MQIHTNGLASQWQMSSMLGSSSDAKKLIRSGKQRRNKKHNNGVKVSIKRKSHKEGVNSAGLEEANINYGHLVFQTLAHCI